VKSIGNCFGSLHLVFIREKYKGILNWVKKKIVKEIGVFRQSLDRSKCLLEHVYFHVLELIFGSEVRIFKRD
jgi:hypothetical protein